MTLTLSGKHLIAGQWIGPDLLNDATTFESEPARGPVRRFAAGTVTLVDQACTAAEEAFWSYGYAPRAARADFLNAIADEIDARAAEITEIGCQETGLPEARLMGERGRTTGRQFETVGLTCRSQSQCRGARAFFEKRNPVQRGRGCSIQRSPPS